ncbi:anti-anti-sigma factor [Solemya pervernicosa gill symbiont]|uniref:Anti-anti-sigma factor n=2 Tax=Gammaproteobacteria incertae sedis TaxID=118884 RepID=A0A1T2L170_9GAMM|nr:STAS domain-containing protein [Candidatus Reidiella endopervernicosa]OOZ38812.1 anti-anti-sigma factor [Solemya pervernicosa gill symbiont]QKQ27441.1 STAS domain-containing protein [Candidatus Reidiella endopervernicosa]
MPITTTMAADNSTVNIAVSGRFDFNLHKDFREAYKQQDVKAYVIDLAGTEYMDSSALGMLLLLREHAGGDSSDIKIINANPEISKILTISNFHRLFNVS